MENKRKITTLVMVRDDNRILLGFKKRGFGMGKWNGFGGKVECGESITIAAFRELREECNLNADSLKKIGILLFQFIGDPILLEVHVFVTDRYSGQIQESDEMKPQWFCNDEIPFDQMWADDIHWFPLMFKGSRFTGFFVFEGTSKIIDFTLKEIIDSECEIKPLK